MATNASRGASARMAIATGQNPARVVRNVSR
jgi:hypothetical protein